VGRKPKLDEATWEWAKNQFNAEKKSWEDIAEALGDRGIKISRVALSKRYNNELTAAKKPARKPRGDNSGKKKLPGKNDKLRVEMEKLTEENLALQRRLGLLEGVVEMLVKKEVQPTVGALDTFAVCPSCGEKSKSVKSHWERRFYCRNKECERKTFIAPLKPEAEET
jgi:hypothetical protein